MMMMMMMKKKKNPFRSVCFTTTINSCYVVLFQSSSFDTTDSAIINKKRENENSGHEPRAKKKIKVKHGKNNTFIGVKERQKKRELSPTVKASTKLLSRKKARHGVQNLVVRYRIFGRMSDYEISRNFGQNSTCRHLIQWIVKKYREVSVHSIYCDITHERIQKDQLLVPPGLQECNVVIVPQLIRVSFSWFEGLTAKKIWADIRTKSKMKQIMMDFKRQFTRGLKIQALHAGGKDVHYTFSDFESIKNDRLYKYHNLKGELNFQMESEGLFICRISRQTL